MTSTTRVCMGLMALGLALGARAADVTVALVASDQGRTVPLTERQSLWKSPFGGWVVTAWPFALRVDDKAILEYRSTEQKLMAQATDDGTVAMLNESLGTGETVRPEDLKSFRLDRDTEATVSAGEGKHTIQPFGIEFTVTADGVLASADPRLRVDAKARRLEVLCHAVTIRLLSGDRSVTGPVQVTCGGVGLLGGLEAVLAEYENKSKSGAAGANTEAGFRRVTLYLPASTLEKPYAVNGATFGLGGTGTVKLAADSQARCQDGHEIQVLLPPKAPAATCPFGIRWTAVPEKTGGDDALSCGAESVAFSTGTGAAWLPVPAAGKPALNLGRQALRLPEADPRWPHRQLRWDAGQGVCWLIESAPLVAKPGAAWSCRVTAVYGKGPVLPQALAARLEPLGTGAEPVELKLAAREDGVYAAALPAAGGPWQLVAAADSPMAGQPLGLVLVATDTPKATVTLYATNNRGLFRRGDAVDVFWTVKAGADLPAADYPVVLRGAGLESAVGKAAVGALAGGKVASGCVRLDTAALAPGTYEAAVRADGVVTYPLRFRIVQREPLTDYEIYSYVFGEAKPSGDTRINAYYGKGDLTAEPGLAPFFTDVTSGLDPALAGYAAAVAGPALEFFQRPPTYETALMVLASLGARAVPNIPPMLHHEEWNPKHSLPEELASLRRRLALFVQPRADIAGFGGLALNWYATLGGYWEESPALDGHQAARNAAANKWVADQAAARVAAEKARGADAKRLEAVGKQAAFEARSMVLPNAYAQYLADANIIRPGLTSHSGIPSFWLGGGHSYPPVAYASLTQRDSVDYTDYGISPWGNFRAPAFLAMGNLQDQKTYCCYMTYGRHSRIATCFGAIGRGLDGISLNGEDPYGGGEDGALLSIVERFGSYFSTLEPLPDVAVYYSPLTAWPQQKSVILHDLARMRRPGMLLTPEDVLAGRLKDCRVLFLAAIGEGEPQAVLDAFAAFEKAGGAILKDQLCAAGLPGKDIGFGYDKDHVHSGWGLAYPNGEWEFAHLWSNFKEKREKLLVEAFAKTAAIPVTTPDADVIISPLAGKESICCFVINQTLVPMSIEGKWRQHAVLPRPGTLLVQDGWFVRDLLAGKAVTPQGTPQGRSLTVDFTRMEGAIYLLTRREPAGMAMRTERTAPATVRLAAWLTDAKDQPLTDPLPFEVTLKGPGGTVLFHKFAGLSPDRSLDVPVPALAGNAALELAVRDLVLGCTATLKLEPAAPATVATRADADIVGTEAVAAFLGTRQGPVTVLLDERQAAYRPAADALAALLGKAGRATRVMVCDPADVRFLPLRWKPTEEDKQIRASLADGKAVAWRADMSPWVSAKPAKGAKSGDRPAILFDDPRCGYGEYGPRTWFEGDVVLFGSPETHFAVQELLPYLRRVPTANYPAPGGFFLHYLWDPFAGGFDGIYIACHDAVGAEAGVKALADVPGKIRAGALPLRPRQELGQPLRASRFTAPAEPGRSETPSVSPAKSSAAAATEPAAAAVPSGVPPEPPTGEQAHIPAPKATAFGAAAVTTRGGAPGTLENMITGRFGTRVLDAAFTKAGRLFVTADSYGDSLFVVGANGEIQEKRALQNRCGNNIWSRLSGTGLRAVDDASFYVHLWDSDYLYALDKGLVSRAVNPGSGFTGRFKVPVAASTRLTDAAKERIYLGGAGKLRALDARGAVLWVYDDTAVRTSTDDLLYPRSLFPRAVSGDGRVLLVAGFGIQHDCYSIGKAVNASICGLDTATGKVLWQQDGMLLNEGKAIPVENRFIVVDDSGGTRLLNAADGQEAGRLRSVTGSDWILPVPGREELLVIENNAFDRHGPTARVYFRPLGDAPDRPLAVEGRVTDVALAPDKQSFTLATARGLAHRVGLDGKPLWRTDVPTGGIVRLAPDGQTVLVGARDGVLHWLNAKDGSRVRTLDINPFNTTSGERFVKQYSSIGEVPVDKGASVLPAPPAASYLESLSRKAVPFGPNLVSADQWRTALKPGKPLADDPAKPAVAGVLPPETKFTLKVEAGKTYLVELLAAAAAADKLTPQTRLELTVTGARKNANLPYSARLPLARFMERRRIAFRADDAGEVTLTLRTVQPHQTGEGKSAKLSYNPADASEAGLLAGDLVVAAFGFTGQNLVLDGGPAAKVKPQGNLSCEVKPWTGGNSTIRWQPYPCPKTALQLVDGLLANPDTGWTTAATGQDVAYAEARVKFKKPQTVVAIAIYEDPAGPALAGGGVRELTAMRYGVYIHEAKANRWQRIGAVAGNTNLVNVFECPAVDIDEIQYFWAGRNDSDRTDGVVRMAELEVYSAEEAGLDVDDLMKEEP